MHGTADQLVPGPSMQWSSLSTEAVVCLRVLGSPEVVLHRGCSSVAGWPRRQVSLARERYP